MRADSDNVTPYVCIIGCANIDVVGYPNDRLVMKDANQGKLHISIGGVGRNIAENLTRLGLDIKLITVIGDDVFSTYLQQHCDDLKIDISHSLFVSDHVSSVHMAIMDEVSDLAVAVSAMSLYDNMNTEFISTKHEIISNALLTVMDTSMPKDVIEYVLSQVRAQKYFVEVDAGPKVDRIKDSLGSIDFLKLNRIEAELLCNRQLENEKDIEKAASDLHDMGVKIICISLGQKGLYYSSKSNGDSWLDIGGSKDGFVCSRSVPVVNTNGAGDAMASGLVYGIVKGKTLLESIRYGQACAMLNIQDVNTVSDTLTEIKMTELSKNL